MRLAALLRDVHTAAAIAVDRSDLVGSPQGDQPHRTHDVSGDVALALPARRERRHVATGSATSNILWCFSETNRLTSTPPERAEAFQSMSRTSSPGTYGRRSSNSMLRVCSSA